MSLIKMKLLQVELFLEAREPRQVDETAPGSRKAREMLKQAHEPKPDWCRNLTAAHQLNHELNQVLPLIATDEYVYATLECELKKKEDPEHRVLITGLFNQREIVDLLDRQRGGLGALTRLHESKAKNRQRAEQLLTRLYEARDERWRYERAVVTLKRYYLLFHAIVVGIFLVSLGGVIISAGEGAGQVRDQLLLVTLAGAMGSTLAAMLKLRDAVVRLNDLPAMIVVVVAQALIGAALGLIAWLLLSSGAVQLGGDGITGWKTYGLVGFAAGFSEPFSLRLIARFIGAS